MKLKKHLFYFTSFKILTVLIICLSACENSNPVYESISIVYHFPNSNYTLISKNNPQIKDGLRYGIGDANGKPISEIKYGSWGYTPSTAIHYYGNGIFRVGLVKDSTIKFGLMDSTGKELTELKFNYIEHRFSKEGFVAAFVDNGNNGNFSHFTWFGNGKWGYLDRTGKEVVETKYDAICCFTVRDANAFPEQYGYFFASGLTFMMLNNKWGFIDTVGNVVISPLYDYVSSFAYAELSVVALGEKYGYINTTGAIVIPIIYDKASPFWNADGTAWVKLDGKNLKINKQGEIVE